MNTRREFVIRAPLGLLGAVAACQSGQLSPSGGQAAEGTPPAFNTAPPVGPEVSAATFAEAEKLAQVSMTEAQRAMAAKSWRTSMAALLERRTGPRKVALEPELAPATAWDPAAAAPQPAPARDRFVRGAAEPGSLPSSDEDIAFATVARLSRWIERRQLTSERLTRIYLDRIRRID